jgi:polyferredoxin
MSELKLYRAKRKRVKAWRLAVLVIFLAAATTLGCLHQLNLARRPVGVDALCPFGGIESAITVIATGTMLERVAWSSFILLLAVLVVALVFRRSFCGHICPLGALQELAARLGRGVLGRRLTIPAAADRPLRYLKYAVLVVFVALSVVLGKLAIRPYDPWAAWNHLIGADLFTGFLVGFIVLVASLLGSLLFDRFFCKYLCPMGAFLALLRPIGWFRVRRNEATCTHCYACDKACPVNIRVEATDQVRSLECIDCNLCVNACPVPDTLTLNGPRGRTRATAAAALWITVAIFAVVIGVTSLTGDFQWTVRPLAETVRLNQGFDPALIKGSDSFQAVSELTGIPREEFLRRFRISEEQFAAPIRDAAHRASGGFETEEVREFVRERLGPSQ